MPERRLQHNRNASALTPARASCRPCCCMTRSPPASRGCGCGRGDRAAPRAHPPRSSAAPPAAPQVTTTPLSPAGTPRSKGGSPRPPRRRTAARTESPRLRWPSDSAAAPHPPLQRPPPAVRTQHQGNHLGLQGSRVLRGVGPLRGPLDPAQCSLGWCCWMCARGSYTRPPGSRAPFMWRCGMCASPGRHVCSEPPATRPDTF